MKYPPPHRYFQKCAIAIAGLSVILLLLFNLNKIANVFEGYKSGKQNSRIENLLREKLDYATRQRDELVSSGVFDAVVRERNSFQALVVAQQEAKKRNLGFIVVVDENGFVLARSHMPSQKGDNVFITAPPARKIAAGQKVAGFSKGGRSPLAIVAGAPIAQNGSQTGALILGYIVNDEFAKKLKDQSAVQADLAFFSYESGLIGSTFADDSAKQLLNSYLTPGSDAVFNPEESTKELKMGGNEYFLTRTVLLNLDGQAAADMIIFYPLSHRSVAGTFAVIAALIFFVCSMFFISGETIDREEYAVIFGVLSVGVFMLVFLIGLSLYSVPKLKKPAYAIYNSTLKLEPESDVIRQFTEKTVAVKVLTGGETINVVKAVVGYDPAAAKVVDIVMTNSLCNNDFLLEKSIDNKTGRAVIACGIPNPGFSEPDGTVAELVIRPLVQGSFSLKFIDDDMQVLANDGLGTNVLRATTDAFLQVLKPEFSAQKITDSLPVFSPSHPNSNRWYNDKNISLLWPGISPNSRYYYALNGDSSYKLGRKDEKTEQPGMNLSVGEDGVYYFHIRAENEKGIIGPVSHFKIMIDSTTPLPPTILVSESNIKKGEIVRINLASRDETSGLQSGFFLRINDEESFFLPVKPPLYLPIMDPGEFTVTARVFDRAGNFSDSSVTLRAGD